MAVPPIATKIFLFASISREFRCQWPLVTPAALTGNGCADASAGTSMNITHDARSSFFTATLRRISSSKFHICLYEPRRHEERGDSMFLTSVTSVSPWLVIESGIYLAGAG